MDVNRGEGLDGEHASPGRTLPASSPSSQKFLRLPPPLAGGKSFLFVLVSLCFIVYPFVCRFQNNNDVEMEVVIAKISFKVR